MTDFDRFWAAYPRRVGKLAAMALFAQAVKHVTVDEILAGVERYKENKPEYADWCHPVTWLRQGRWMDEPDAEIVKADIRGHNPPCRTHADCIAKTLADARKEREAS